MVKHSPRLYTNNNSQKSLPPLLCLSKNTKHELSFLALIALFTHPLVSQRKNYPLIFLILHCHPLFLICLLLHFFIFGFFRSHKSVQVKWTRTHLRQKHHSFVTGKTTSQTTSPNPHSFSPRPLHWAPPNRRFSQQNSPRIKTTRRRSALTRPA